MPLPSFRQKWQLGKAAASVFEIGPGIRRKCTGRKCCRSKGFTGAAIHSLRIGIEDIHRDKVFIEAIVLVLADVLAPCPSSRRFSSSHG